MDDKDKSIKCEICGEPFTPTRPWNKYCSKGCRDRAKKKTANEWYREHKKEGLLSNITLQELIENSPYKEKYRLIVTKLGEHGTLSFSQLKRTTRFSDDVLSRYLRTIKKFGIISLCKKKYGLTTGFINEPFKLFHMDHIKMCYDENIMSSPFFITYLKGIKNNQLDEEDQEDYSKLEKNMAFIFKDFVEWFRAIQNKQYGKIFYKKIDESGFPPILKLYLWVQHVVSSAFQQYIIPPLLGRDIFSKRNICFKDEDEMLDAIEGNVIISMLNSKYVGISAGDMQHDFLDIYNKFFDKLDMFNMEISQVLSQLSEEIDCVIASLPMVELTQKAFRGYQKKFCSKQYNYEAFQSQSARGSLDQIYEIMPNNGYVYPKSDTQKKMVYTKDYTFRQGWETAMKKKILSTNPFISNIMNSQPWETVFKELKNAIGSEQDFTNYWNQFLSILDYWAFLTPMPLLPRKYSELFLGGSS